MYQLGYSVSKGLTTKVFNLMRGVIEEWVSEVMPKYTVKAGGAVAVDEKRLCTDKSGRQIWAVAILDMNSPLSVTLKIVDNRSSGNLVGAIRDCVPTTRRARTTVITDDLRAYKKLRLYEYEHTIGFDNSYTDHPIKQFWREIMSKIRPYKCITPKNHKKLFSEAYWKYYCDKHSINRNEHLLSLIKRSSKLTLD